MHLINYISDILNDKKNTILHTKESEMQIYSKNLTDF